jgi:arginine deiminase
VASPAVELPRDANAMTIQVDSEIGRLRRVLLHRPGREIDWMVPSMMEELLFDDILDGPKARREHDVFRQLLERAGVEVLDAGRLLVEVLAKEEARNELAEILGRVGLPAERRERLLAAEPEVLARRLVGGVRTTQPSPRQMHEALFDLLPVPNYFFQRDPQVILGRRVVISSMATAARAREPLLARLLFRHHPALAGHEELFDLGEATGWGGLGPTLEGGDVLIARPDLLLIGVSERTNRRGVERLAEHLRAAATPLRHLLLVDLPRRRSYMHLDTVFTLVDRGTCLAFPPVIEGDGPEAASIYQVDLGAGRLTFTLRTSLRKALDGLGMELELIPCGGADDPVDQEREQWSDGANAFALAPGVICLYRRNRRTVDELARRGWRVLGEEEVLSGEAEVLGGGPTVLTLVCDELARARGGPRCMTTPLAREPL